MKEIPNIHSIRKQLVRLTRSIAFNSVIAVVIILNLFFVGLEQDLGGSGSGSSAACSQEKINQVGYQLSHYIVVCIVRRCMANFRVYIRFYFCV